jgi:transposase
MKTKSRKQYTEEFKREAIRLVTKDGYKVAEAARSLGINATMLRRWIQIAEGGAATPFPGKGILTSEQEEILKLREENKRLRQEKEILKKATAFFAKEGN